ncbi:MAG: hypothetical protein M9934_09125 [Thermomicrobiales bacterium]|nr:hypothetical protein [Thermomicrobiales bacterium]MCO5219463.1 hypothetical protein [Thermomicrobiales bacterium]MCO5228435.1 hypothetical protein [Thermomicrobiales bacterium]
MNRLSDLTSLSPQAQTAIAFAIIPLLILLAWALTIWWRTPANRFQTLPKWVWLVIILITQPLGPSIFLAVGRSPAPASEPKAITTSNDSIADLLYVRDEEQ